MVWKIIVFALVAALCARGNAQAVRIINGNVCGSGTVCGSDTNSTYILTNAHVVGTSIGRVVRVRENVNGSDQEFDASVHVAAFSDQQITDWAILKTAKRAGPEWKLSKVDPTGTKYVTCGSPRCVWPLVCGSITSVNVGHGTTPWTWTPDAIGGQSGSSIRNDAGAFGLLTWSWSGRGAGQLTSTIYRQLREKSTEAPKRPIGLREVQAAQRHETENGFHEGEVSVRIDLPIWIDDTVVPPPQGFDPIKIAKLIQLLIELLDLIRSLR